MSVSGVGGSNSWYQQWLTLQRSKGAGSAGATSTASALGQSVTAGASTWSGVQSVTGASGQSMNNSDSQTFQQTMSSIGQDLKSGDVTAAQADFQKLQQLLKSSGLHGHHHHHGAKPPAGAGDGASASASPFASAFGALGQSLANGDLSGAQTAFDQLDGLLRTSANRLTNPPIGANSPANPAGGSVNVVA